MSRTRRLPGSIEELESIGIGTRGDGGHSFTTFLRPFMTIFGVSGGQLFSSYFHVVDLATQGCSHMVDGSSTLAIHNHP